MSDALTSSRRPARTCLSPGKPPGALDASSRPLFFLLSQDAAETIFCPRSSRPRRPRGPHPSLRRLALFRRALFRYDRASRRDSPALRAPGEPGRLARGRAQRKEAAAGGATASEGGDEAVRGRGRGRGGAGGERRERGRTAAAAATTTATRNRGGPSLLPRVSARRARGSLLQVSLSRMCACNL